MNLICHCCAGFAAACSDAIALRVVNDDLAQSMYTSMTSIDGLRPCAFTIPNFPDYDDS
jgi:hypothetical protein